MIKIDDTTVHKKNVKGIGIEIVQQVKRQIRKPDNNLKLKLNLNNQYRTGFDQINAIKRSKRWYCLFLLLFVNLRANYWFEVFQFSKIEDWLDLNKFMNWKKIMIGGKLKHIKNVMIWWTLKFVVDLKINIGWTKLEKG